MSLLNQFDPFLQIFFFSDLILLWVYAKFTSNSKYMNEAQQFIFLQPQKRNSVHNGMSIILICMLYVFLSILISSFNPLSANPQIWLNTLKQFVGKLPTNCLSVFDHLVKLALKGLINPIQATLKGKLTIYFKVQCVKSVQIRSFSGPYSPIF